MDSLQHIKSEVDPYTDAEVSASQQFTHDLKTPSKSESTYEEFLDDNGSSNSDCYFPENYRYDIPFADDDRTGAGIADKDSVSCEFCQHIYPKELIQGHMSETHPNATYDCQFCSRSFKKKRYLKSHLITHAKDRKREFVCESCGNAFYTKGELVRHMKEHTGDTHNCHLCDARYKQKRNLKTHMRRQHSDKTQKFASVHTKSEFMSDEEIVAEGNGSDAAFYTQKDPQSTAEKKTKDRKREFVCETCQSAFYTKGELVRHMKDKIGDTHNCQLCEARYKQKRNLETHVRLKHSGKTQTPETLDNPPVHTKTELLSEENGSDSVSELLKSQMSQPEFEGTIKCRLCLRSFKEKQYLKRHLITHAKDRKREFVCETCQSAFYTKGELVRHMKDHTGDTYNCQLCKARYKQKRNLETHMRRKHSSKKQKSPSTPETLDNPWVHTRTELMSEENGESWEFGPKSYPQELLKSHSFQIIKTESMSDEEFLDDKNEDQHFRPNSSDAQQNNVNSSGMDNVTCELCHKIYPKQLFKTHMRLMHCRGKYECVLCLRTFKEKRYLKRHLITHSKERRPEFACLSCECAFYTKRSLVRHSRTHTGYTNNSEISESSLTDKDSQNTTTVSQNRDETTQCTQDSQTSIEESKIEFISDEEFIVE